MDIPSYVEEILWTALNKAHDHGFISDEDYAIALDFLNASH